MLEKHWPELKDTNELWEQGLKENRCLGKSKAVLASGLSHDAVFVRVPGGRAVRPPPGSRRYDVSSDS